MNTSLPLPLRILGARLIARPRPFLVDYALVAQCNARCAMCDAPERRRPGMSTEDHLKTLSALADLGASRIYLTGGEPLLHPALGEVVDHILALGMVPEIVTNGILVPRTIAVLRRCRRIFLSLDGREAVHDAGRGHGSFRAVLEALAVLRANDVPVVLTALLTRENLSEIDWLIALAESTGSKIDFELTLANPHCFGDEAKRWQPDEPSLRKALEQILAAQRRGAPVLTSAASYERALAWRNFDIENVELPGARWRCAAGRFFLRVEANGDVYPCDIHVGRLPHKNVLHDGVKAAWLQAQEHSCVGCPSIRLNEKRAAVGARPGALVRA